ncbi:unnamed protein product [Rotaria sp. Silwood1]|nr:unnamed protein product [Rotaria sp. Silwood1]
MCLQQLCHFLNAFLANNTELSRHSSTENENQQYLVALNPLEETPLRHDLDMDTCCILLNLFQNRLPSFHQILWCSTTTEDDIHLFFSCVRTFHDLTFVIMNIDKMHHRLRELLLNEQDSLARLQQPHGVIYYVVRGSIINRKNLRSFQIHPKHRDPHQTCAQLLTLYRQNYDSVQPQFEIICGASGIGKTHHINTNYKNGDTINFSVNDKLSVSLLVSLLLLYDSKTLNDHPSIYFNISIHAPFEELNRAFFSLFVCGSLTDVDSGLTFSLSNTKSWKFIMEIPHTNKYAMNIRQNFNNILPLMSIIASNSIEEVTGENYQLFIGEEEELVARFLKADENGTINRLLIVDSDNKEKPVEFDKLASSDECRQHIYDCINKYAPELPKNKIYEISFVKFLYRRIRFFTSHFYCFNMVINNLGSIAMKQMIHEAKHLAQIDFRCDNYPRTYLVYDPNFSLQLLYHDWNNVFNELKQLFNYREPKLNNEFQKKNYLAVCLSWLLDMQYETFEKIRNNTKFILTESFAYKLFHVHERKLTKLPLIIEGETGVGKTFLLTFYSLLLNANITNGSLQHNIAPRIRERISLWLLHNVIIAILENESNLLSIILRQIKQKLKGFNNDDQKMNSTAAHPLDLIDKTVVGIENDNNEGDDENLLHGSSETHLENIGPDLLDENGDNQGIEIMPQVTPQHRLIDPIDIEFLKEIKRSLQNFEHDNNILQYIWKTIITISSENQRNITKKLILELYNYITSQLSALPLIEASHLLKNLLNKSHSSSIHTSIRMFNEYLCYTQVKPVFYRLLLHPGVTEEQLEEFMSPIVQLARALHSIELVVFFDEINTSSCLGLFKAMFMDRTLHGTNLPENIFFTAAINPASTLASTDNLPYRLDYVVHQLPQALEGLRVSYGILESKTLADYIRQKIAMFNVRASNNLETRMPLQNFAQDLLSQSILAAQEFCETRLGKNTVSQREIQRCFNLIEFFWKMRYDGETNPNYQPNPIRCITLSIALIYYFRLPTEEDNRQRNDHHTPTREELGSLLSDIIPDFVEIIQLELEKFVNIDNFVIPHGVAINQAVREHLFAIVVSVVTRTPLCIIGAPGQSKTLSFQIALQNLQGPQLSTKQFCKRLPSIDPVCCLGSKYSRSEDIAYVFDRAIQREQQYKQYRMNTRCVVFLDKASLPDEKKMVLKVLHSYLDECKVAFIAVANKPFDAANANRMICIYRSRPSEVDQKILAYGCLGLDIKTEKQMISSRTEAIVHGLCQGYRQVLMSSDIPHIFHDRDFIYMLRELRFELTKNSTDDDTYIDGITPKSLLHALEDNFNGINEEQFQRLVQIFLDAVRNDCDDFVLPSKEQDKTIYRNVPTIIRESMELDSIHRRLYGRYKLIIDESEDESAVHLLFQSGLLSSDPKRTTVFRMSDFAEDINNELRNTEILSNIKLCMETGKTILMVNTERIHGSLYDVFNQNFSIMATYDTRKIFSKVAIGPKTIDVVVHEDFQCIIHVKRNEVIHIPAPFLSRFQKYSLSVNDFYRIQLKRLVDNEQTIIKNVEEKVQSFIQHFGRQYFYGLNENTLYSCLLPLIKINDNQQYYLSNPSQHYTQLTIKSKSFIEKNPTDVQQCLLRLLLSKLIQLVSPESIILKLPTLEETIAQSLCINYFQQQEHFNIENFIRELISKPLINIDNNELLKDTMDESQTESNILITKKVMIFTRTSSYLDGLNKQTKSEFFNNDDFYGYDGNYSDKIDVINLASIENSVEIQDEFHTFGQDEQKTVLIIVIEAQQSYHIPFLQQLIDHTQYTYNADMRLQPKYFLMLVHSPARQLYNQFCFASIFLNNWDFYFFDTYISESAFHLQKMLQILLPSSKEPEESFDNILLDLNTSFDDCLWDFCSKIQIILQELPQEMFKNKLAHQFYQRRTGIIIRVQCLKQILQESTQLQKQQNTIVHQHHDVARRVTTADNTDSGLNETVILSTEQFRSELVTSVLNDTTLTETITEHVLDSYLNDLVRTFCTVLEKQFTDDHTQSEKAIDFIGQWLRLVDDDDLQSLQLCANRNVFLLAYAYTLFEYVQDDVLSLYSACRDYVILHFTGLLLCDTNLNSDNTKKLMNIVKTLIEQYLSIDEPMVQFSHHLQLFLATIISKRSWSFLLDLLKSDRIRNVNNQWADYLYRLLESKELVRLKKDLQLCHQLQFTVASKSDISSIFPHLHVFYDELCKTIENCITSDALEDRWKPLSDWIETKLHSDPVQLTSNEIKAMLVLNIYYNYYCSNQLLLVQPLLEIVNDTLEPLPEDLQVFQALLQPEQHIIGYSEENVNEDINYLNRLFKLDCNEKDELGIRHCLVNLMAMILMGGKQSFLWTFAFEPLTLENTYGFGSTTHYIIEANGIHYDCGCVLTLNGDLFRFPTRTNHNIMNVPAVYTVLFSTFGAMAWHLLLFNTSIENLHGHILAPSAIADNAIDVRTAGNNLRTKICHFVRARLLSTFNFLSIRSSQDDACILLGRCFEQMAFLTVNQQDSWIKPIYSTLEDELNAEMKYQSEVFFLAYQNAAKHKTYINELQLQSEIQTSLHKFITQMPMTIQFSHFEAELCNPTHSRLPLKLLRYILDSIDVLKMMKYIPDLTRFYLLLHQTYTQLIERDEFIEVTLKKLYDRAQTIFVSSHHQQYPHETDNHFNIINKGIEAINAYHKFTDGLIRPGACDETQRFSTVSFDTPVHYFVTTENHDEGDITMRILSVLVDYHNSLLDLIEQTMSSDENHGVGILKIMANELISKEVSILIIAGNNNGFITLTDDDFSWIEQLCRASLLVDDEYFPKFGTKFTVDFMYLQSYIIRTYLLRCHINYRQIVQKYQCYVRQIKHMNTTENTEILDLGENYAILLDERQLETDWKHLKLMYLDKLYHGHNFLRQIATILRHNSDDHSSKGLYEFVESGTEENAHLREQLERYEIKDFQLCYIDHVRQLYEKSIGGFQYLFTDVPHLLHTPIDEQSHNELNQIIESALNLTNENLQIDEIQSIVQRITEFSNELKAIENTLLEQSTRSLREICEYITVENPIISLIPDVIKCEHYVSLNIYLIQLRSILQERTINIQEREATIWSENFDLQSDAQQQDRKRSCYQDYLTPMTTVDNDQKENDSDEWSLLPIKTEDLVDNTNNETLNVIDRELEPKLEFEVVQNIEDEISSEYRSLFKLSIRFVPLTCSTLVQQVHEQEHSILSTIATRAQRYTLKYPDGKKPSSHMCTNIERVITIVHIVIGLGRVLREHKVIQMKYPLPEFVIIHKGASMLKDVECFEYFILETKLVETDDITIDYSVGSQTRETTYVVLEECEEIEAILRKSFKRITLPKMATWEPDDDAQRVTTILEKRMNWLPIIIIVVSIISLLIVGLVVFVLRKRRANKGYRQATTTARAIPIRA